MTVNQAKKIFVFYHFLPPDEVVSSVHFGQLAAGILRSGWQVKAFTSNRMRHDLQATLPATAHWNGVEIQRVWRPKFSQHSVTGRLLNGIFLLLNWMLRLLIELPRQRPDVVFFGTDPIMSIVLSPIVKLVSPKTRTVQWCFDLYPEALQADGILSANALPYRVVNAIARRCYQHTDAIIDIGRCMKQRIQPIAPRLRFETVHPWAMKEFTELPTVDASLRQSVYGEAKIACHYSGNLGHAHEFGLFLRVAQSFSPSDLRMRFSVRGSRVRDLNQALQYLPKDLVRVDDLVPESQIEDHLRTADIHLVSLKENWSGIVVPSKFFGAMAVGRPVLFAGPVDSEIALIIGEEKVGWVLNEQTFATVCADISQILQAPDRLSSMRLRCFELYRRRYSQSAGINRLDRFLRGL